MDLLDKIPVAEGSKNCENQVQLENLHDDITTCLIILKVGCFPLTTDCSFHFTTEEEEEEITSFQPHQAD